MHLFVLCLTACKIAGELYNADGSKTTMTQRMMALNALNDVDCPERSLCKHLWGYTICHTCSVWISLLSFFRCPPLCLFFVVPQCHLLSFLPRSGTFFEAMYFTVLFIRLMSRCPAAVYLLRSL